MEKLQSNICKQWGTRLKTIIRVTSPTSPENETVAAREEAEGEEEEVKIAGLLVVVRPPL